MPKLHCSPLALLRCLLLIFSIQVCQGQYSKLNYEKPQRNIPQYDASEFDSQRDLEQDISFTVMEIMVEQDTLINSKNPTKNYGDQNTFYVSLSSDQQFTSFISTPDLSGEVVNELQLCLFKDQWGQDKNISVHIVYDDWDESNLTWSESVSRQLISNDIIFTGPIRNLDWEMQCYDIGDEHIDKINDAKGVALVYDEGFGSFSFTSSEFCEDASRSNYPYLFCPHWRYKTMPSTESVNFFFPQNDAQIGSNNAQDGSYTNNIVGIGSGVEHQIFMGAPDFLGSVPQDLQLCMYKSDGGHYQNISIHILNGDWDEANITWTESQQKSMISNDIIWAGEITARDNEMQCMMIDDNFAPFISAGTGVALIYTDPSGFFRFAASEKCASAISTGPLDTWHCPHWRYKESATLQPTPSPTSHLQKWSIGPADYTVIQSNIFDGMLEVEHPIGSSVGPNQVTVRLFDKGCRSSKSETGLEVSLVENAYSSTPFIYNVVLNQTLIGSSPGNFVTFTNQADTGNSRGSIEFCTRVATYEGSVMVVIRETNFKLNFDLTDNSFSIFGIDILQNSIDAFATLVEDSYGVGICQCDGNYNCYSSSAPDIKQDQNLVLCLFPTADGDASDVHISNFNLRIVTLDNSYGYSPVVFGFNTWAADALTDVSIKDGTDRIKVSTPIVAQFYIQGFESLDVRGEAFLEFDSASKQDNPVFNTFKTQIGIEIGAITGCFEQLFTRMRSSFF